MVAEFALTPPLRRLSAAVLMAAVALSGALVPGRAGAQDQTRLAAAGDPGGLVLTPLVITPLPVETPGETTVPVLRATVPTDPAEGAPGPTGASPPAAPTPQTLPVRPGLPLPSVIVGELATLLAPDRRGPLGVPRDTRDRIRQIDPARFDRMLGGGGFDPQEDQLAAAIQTELSTFGCYDGGIDGDWGGGSVSALRRYFDAAGESGPTDPALDLFRQMAGSGAVRCPEIRTVAPAATPAARQPAAQPAAQPASQPARGNAARRDPAPARERQTTRQPQTQPAAQPAARTPQAARQPQAQPNSGGGGGGAPRINPSLMGSGVFR